MFNLYVGLKTSNTLHEDFSAIKFVFFIILQFVFNNRLLCFKFSADAEAFLNVLKRGNVNDVKEILGQHAMERHVRCQNIKKGFANYIHKTGEILNVLFPF